MPAKYTPDQRIAAFWSRVDRYGPLPEHDPSLGRCWLWTGGRSDKGYGWVNWNGRSRKAHVVAYILTTGHEPPAEAPVVRHLCDGGYIGCVRPGHLVEGTPKANTADMLARGRSAKGEQHGMAKLTAEQVLEIRARYAAGGISQEALGREYGVSGTTVCHAVRGKQWGHIR